jgi:hypothetical protein
LLGRYGYACGAHSGILTPFHFLFCKSLWYDARLGRITSELINIMSNGVTANSPPRYLVPADTATESSGQSVPLELGSLAGKPLLLVLRIKEVLEQESLHLSIWGSADGQNWGPQALFWFPQKFYCGVTPAALDLRQRPEFQFLQAHWEVNRWGRGIPRPYFKFTVEVQEAGD